MDELGGGELELAHEKGKRLLSEIAFDRHVEIAFLGALPFWCAGNVELRSAGTYQNTGD